MKAESIPSAHGAVLALLTLLFFFRVLGQALVVFFSLSWLPSNEQWASGLVPYPILLTVQVVMLNRHDQDRLPRVARQRVFYVDATAFGAFSRRLQRDLREQHAAALRYNHDLAPRDALVRRHDTDLLPFRVGRLLVHVGKLPRSRSDICKP